ncbi:MAG: hypothetical protein RLZ98_1611 [Pseudomonadota bacterium]
MQVQKGFDHTPPALRGAAIAIGNFDGVHRGHQAVLAETQRQAAVLGTVAGVMLFEPHPRRHFRPDQPHFQLTPLPRKLELLGGLGLDLAAVLSFDHELATLDAATFASRVLVGGLGVRHVVIGHDFFFGRNRGGNPEFMQALGADLGFGVTVVAPVAAEGEVFSSSAIRAKLAAGRVREAAEMLGHWWRVTGTIAPGAKIGTSLGFPTANFALEAGTALGHGIYAVRIRADGTWYEGAAYLGTRPTFDDGAPVLEVFLFDFSGDLYGRTLDVVFVDYIRQDLRFSDIDALIAQMNKDCDEARRLLAKAAREQPLAEFPLGRI